MSDGEYRRYQRSRNEYDTGTFHPPTHPQGQSPRPMHLTPGEEQRRAFFNPKALALQRYARRYEENIDTHRESNQRSKRNHSEIGDMLSEAMQRTGMGDNGVAVDDAKVKAIIQQKNDREKHRLIELVEEEVAEAAAVLKAAKTRRDILYFATQRRQETPQPRRFPTEMWHAKPQRDFDEL